MSSNIKKGKKMNETEKVYIVLQVSIVRKDLRVAQKTRSKHRKLNFTKYNYVRKYFIRVLEF